MKTALAINQNMPYSVVGMAVFMPLTLKQKRKNGLLQLTAGFVLLLLLPMTFIYFGDFNGHLCAVEARSGQEKWRLKNYGIILGSPVINNGTACFGRAQGYLYALHKEHQTKTRFTNLPEFASPSILFFN